MADSKITALTAISTVDPTADPLVIVDVSDTSMAASGTTKKSTINQLLGAGGTATLASATISGDLTVDTSTLKVDSANNRVGVNTATPRVSLDVASGNAYVSGQFDFGGTGPSAAQGFLSYTGGNTIVGTYGNTSLLFYSNGSEQMRLNSTGLGVGASPIAKLHVKVTGGSDDTLLSYGANQDNFYTAGSSGVHIFRNLGTERMRIDASGNLSIQSDKYLGWGNLDSLIYGSSTSNYIYFRTNATERVRVKSGGQVRFVPLAADPAGAEAGDVYYNSSSNKLKCYNGTTWNDLF